MGRVIGIWQDPSGKVRVGPASRRDHFIPVIEMVRRQGLLNQFILTPVCKTRDQAEDTKRALYSSARYYCSCGDRHCNRKYSNIPSEKNPEGGCPDGGQRIGCRADIVKDKDGALRVQVRFFDKKEATREVIRKYGPDPSAWPYFSKAKKVKANANV